MYWIEGGGDGWNLCCSCAKKELKCLQKRHPKEHFRLVNSGAWEYYGAGADVDEPDSCAFCGVELQCYVDKTNTKIETTADWYNWYRDYADKDEENDE